LLPKKLQSGERLYWQQSQKSNLPVYFIGFVLLLVALYKKRYASVEQEEKNAKESIIRALPEFINKIVLLLNAGLVMNSAFVKAVEDYKNFGQEGDYFYGQMELIFKRIQETNGSMTEELRAFAKRSGVKELMRVSGIISDNISKGANLVEKLQKENEFLWFTRKKQSEEKGRLAESKLTLPLVILLLVLVMITEAPALMKI